VLPRTSIANKCLRIERKTDISAGSMVVSVHGVVVPLVVLVYEATNSSRIGIGRAGGGAVQFASAASVKVTDH
jgi:hypothetical protein